MEELQEGLPIHQKPYILFACPSCQKQQCFFVKSGEKMLSCQQCSYCRIIVDTWLFEECLFCSCKTFFIQKNIHPFFMFLGLLSAIFFVPSTYGLSLPLLWILDLLLSKIISDLLVCYQCQASFSGFHFPKRFKAFQHHIGERYEKKNEK